MFAWNITGFVGFFVGIGAGVLTFTGLSIFWGESQLTKGIGFIAGGLAMTALDLALRCRHPKDVGWRRFFQEQYGGIVVLLPMWGFGLIGLVAGITILLASE